MCNCRKAAEGEEEQEAAQAGWRREVGAQVEFRCWGVQVTAHPHLVSA